MKSWILVALGAFALLALAVPEAQGKGFSHAEAKGRPHLKLSFAGSNFITSSEDGRPTPLGQVGTSIQNGIVRQGNGVFTAQTIVEEAGPDERCTPLVGADLSSTIVVTYRDGSIISLVASAGSFYCTDGSRFFVEFEGTVAGGEGRFEGATGTWEGSATSNPVARVTAEAFVDLD